MFRRNAIAAILVSLFFPLLAEAQSNPVVSITDSDIVGNVTFTSNNTYLLSGLVFVEDGETLTIEPGTVIKARPANADGVISALIVARGGKIFADGTAMDPIIFTAEADNVDDPDDILLTSEAASRGLWGGVIILGRASINAATGMNNIEGIDTTEPRGIYGGGSFPDDNDNSGVFRYVSIRHGGARIGADNEINGLTMGGVGRGTTIEHVEVFYNQDDGFEWFGGTVNTRYLVAAFAGDDSFDYDEGFRGEHQFWFSIQDPAVGDHAGEHDGGTKPEDGRPYASPTILNATYIGRGASSMGGKANNALIFRDNAGGMYFNSIFTEFQGRMLSIEDLEGNEGTDSRARLEAGDLAFQNNILGAFGAGNTPSQLAAESEDHTAMVLSDPGNMIRIEDPQLQGINWNRNRGLDPRPGTNSPAWDAGKLMEEPRSTGFFTDVDYAGAFGTENWAADWSALADLGYFSTAPPPEPPAPGEPEEEAPDAFSLSQNSPNPFGMTTNIEYAVSSTSHILIEVYNIRGQRVAMVVNDIRLPGQYSEIWDAQHLSSGVYFYRFEATADGRTAHVFNRKMTLLK